MTDNTLSSDTSGKSNLVLQPFSEQLDGQYFPGNEDRAQQLNLLTHLVPYGGVILIQGESGIGKTSLLRQLVLRASESCRICELTATDCIDPRNTLRTMMACFAWQAEVDHSLGGAQLRALREHLGILRRNGYAPVIIIDDADAMTDSVFSIFAQIFEDNSENLLTLVLAGNSSLKDRLTNPLLQPLLAHVAHELALTPFSDDEQEDYIRSQLVSIGVNDMGPFHSAALKFIYVASRGVPKRINELAQVIWANRKKEQSGKIKTQYRKWLTQLRYVLPIVLISSAVAVFNNEITTALFSSPELNVAINTDLKTPDSELPQMQIATVATTLNNDSAVQENAGATEPLSGDFQEQKKTTTQDNEARITSIQVVPDEGVKFIPDHINLSSSEPQSVLSSELVSIEVAKQTASDNATQQSAIESRRALESELNVTDHQRAGGITLDVSNQSDRWLSQAPSQFAVQIMAMEAPVVVAYLKRHGIAAEVSTFRVVAAEKTLLAVASGPYLTRSEAVAAAEHWQQQLPGVKPWVRSVASIQQSVTAYHQHLQPTWLAQVADNEQQLMQAVPDEFVVQLIAMDQAAVSGFVQKHGLGDKVMYFRPQPGLYAALMGRYASRDQALAAGHEIASKAKGIRPWVRSVASVQTVIRENRDHPR